MHMTQKNTKKLKGVSKVVVKKEINHSHYLDILTEKETSIKREVTSIKKCQSSSIYIYMCAE